ncbi:MAG: alpha-D-ribose 1-methylphosphonate 5-triphosphate diphosphatase [Ruminococcus sp.]
MIAIENGKIVTPNGVITGKTLWLDNDRIAAIGACDSVPEKTINAHGRYILPGMIDVHSDKIEQFVFPRPTARFSFELALKECEKELLQLGITTIYHSFSLYSDELLGKSPLRTKESVLEMAELIADIQNRSHLIHHRFHLRLEIDNVDAFEIAKDMIQRHLIQEISFMDHTPGQGQYRDLEIYRETVDKYHGMENEGKTFEEVLEHHRNKKILSMEQLQELADLAHQNHITVASHDDDTVEKLQLNRQLGVNISEFPITEEVAKAAHEMGFYTIAGAPNILLGGSHSGNMSAAQAIQNQSVDILCSDYFPQALLHSLFVMCDKYGQTLPDMVNKVSLNPAKAMGIDKDYGSIEVGEKGRPGDCRHPGRLPGGNTRSGRRSDHIQSRVRGIPYEHTGDQRTSKRLLPASRTA